MNHQGAKNGNRFCHNCGMPMVIKEKLSGEDKGKKFWVCTGFKECKTFERCTENERTRKITAGKRPRPVLPWKEKSEKEKIIQVCMMAITAAAITAAVFSTDLTYMVFGDTSKVTDPYFIPMVKTQTDQPTPEDPQQQPPPEQQNQPVMEHIPQQRVNNGEYYQYKDKNGVVSFTDNRTSIPAGAEAKNWNGTATGGKFEILQRGRETQVIVERDRVLVPVKIRSAGVERNLLLLLDTGATSLVVYQDAIPGLRMNNVKNSSARLANGSQVHQLAGNVDSVSVGAAIARDFEINVMQQVGEKDHQGLLGMSFLKNFHYTLDMNRKVIRWN